MSAPKEWTRRGKGSGPCNLFRGRYLITRPGGRAHVWQIIDERQNERIYGTFATLRDAALYIDANREQLPR